MQADSLALQTWLCGLLDASRLSALLDVGCGNGSDLERIGGLVSPDTQLVGLDSTAKALAEARARTLGDKRYVWHQADVRHGLPFGDGAFEALFSHNLLECLPDKPAHLHEMHRVLRPGGQIVCAHWDWEMQTFDCADQSLVRRMVQAFSEWQQAWMAASDGWMGRRLWPVFQRSGLFTGRIETYTLTNTEFAPGWFGYEQALAFGGLARRGLISREDYQRFCEDLAAQAARNEYFYSLTLYVYIGQAL